MYKLDLEKAEEPETKLPTYTRSQKNSKIYNSRKINDPIKKWARELNRHFSKEEKAREFKKGPSTSHSLTILKPSTGWLTKICGKFLKRWEFTRPPYLSPGHKCIQDKKYQLELDMEQWTGSKLGKKYIKAV